MKLRSSSLLLAASLAAPLGLVHVGCGMVERSTQLEDVAYLVFEGATSGLTLVVDDGQPVALRGGGPGTRYSVPSGKRRVRVLRGADTVVDRRILVSTGQSFVITLP